MYKAIIIDDEPWTILDIEQTFALKEMGFEIIGSFRSPLKALPAIMSKKPDLIKEHDGIITVVKATDAVTASDDGVMADQTLQKEKLFVQQGPQTYRYGVLKTAHETYRSAPQTREVYEDSELVLRLGIPVAMVEGDRFCIKVTYPEDLAIAKALYPLFCEKENRWE